MTERVIFYQLTQKFVNEDQDVPEGAQQVIYYSLAIGHHVGVVDCFQSLMEIPLEDYRQWIACLPKGAGRQKMDGVLKWGEIEINRSHVAQLLPALKNALPHMDDSQAKISGTLSHCIEQMMTEPALYLIVRKLA